MVERHRRTIQIGKTWCSFAGAAGKERKSPTGQCFGSGEGAIETYSDKLTRTKKGMVGNIKAGRKGRREMMNTPCRWV